MTMHRARQSFMARRTAPCQNRVMARGKREKDKALRKRIGARLLALQEIYLSHEDSPARDRGHTSAASIARALGIEPQLWNHYIHGSRYPDELVLIRFCRLSGGTTDWVLRASLDGMRPGLAGVLGALYPALVLDGEPADRAAAKSVPEQVATEKI